MQLPVLPEEHRSWDRYKAFHWAVNFANTVTSSSHWGAPAFVVFDTGEVIAPHREAPLDYRRDYSTLGVSLMASEDSGCPQLYFPDTEMGTDPIPKAWLNIGGQQHFLWDYETKRVVATGILENEHRVPQRLRKWSAAYFTGPGSPPVGAPLKVSRPINKAFDLEQRELLDEMLAVCKMQFNMTTPPVWDRTLGQVQTPMDPYRMIAAGSVLALTNNEQWRLFHKGIGRAVTEHDYLLAL